MITVTRLNKSELIINADLIEHIEATPDTVVALTTGKKMVVLESPQIIVERVIVYKRMCAQRYVQPKPGMVCDFE